MDEKQMNKVYFAHKKIIKRWELSYEPQPVVFENGKKVIAPEPEVDERDPDELMVHDMEGAAFDGADAGPDLSDPSGLSADDIIKNFVKTNQDSVNSILGNL